MSGAPSVFLREKDASFSVRRPEQGGTQHENASK